MIALEAQEDRAAAERILDQNDERWRRLRQHSLRVGDFKLSSGRYSTYLFQLRQTTMLPEGAALLGEIILENMYRHSIECIGGLELGAVPIVSSVAVIRVVVDREEGAAQNLARASIQLAAIFKRSDFPEV